MVGKRVLMVEGSDDEHVVKHICMLHGIEEIFSICKYNGVDRLIDGISVRLKESDIGTLGIILDADIDISGRWNAIFSRLTSSGYDSIPASPSLGGTIIQPPGSSQLPKVGIWLMPDNRVPGILEDFLRFLVPQDDALLAHVNDSIQKIPPEQLRFTERKKAKARIHTWLAWQEEPGKPFGQAISARYLDANLPAANTFADWLKRTFT